MRIPRWMLGNLLAVLIGLAIGAIIIWLVF